MTISYRMRRNVSTGALYGTTAFVLLLIGFPAYWLITTSVKPSIDQATYPPVIIPTHFTLDSYTSVFKTDGVPRAFMNSAIIALATTVLTTFLGSLAA
ncbi:MAG: multiple sugar transport system permease protein, partial [Thermomicrobiales bacterium]|nr:multiple sugar transport system permease protein [Thermomicrobiales bacterium]